MDPHYCERIGALIEDDPGIDAIGCNAVNFWDPDDDDAAEASRLLRFERPQDQTRSVPGATFTELLDEGVPPYAGAIRREAWDAHGGFEPSATSRPDVALWLRFGAAGHDVRIVPDKMARNAHEADSHSHDPSNIKAFEERLVTGFTSWSAESRA